MRHMRGRTAESKLLACGGDAPLGVNMYTAEKWCHDIGNRRWSLCRCHALVSIMDHVIVQGGCGSVGVGPRPGWCWWRAALVLAAVAVVSSRGVCAWAVRWVFVAGVAVAE
eukprot:928079-Amphidinium_carterae.1